MSRIVHEGPLKLSDETGSWLGTWFVREYEDKRLVHVIAHEKQATLDISGTQYFREGCEYLANVLFEQLIEELKQAA